MVKYVHKNALSYIMSLIIFKGIPILLPYLPKVGKSHDFEGFNLFTFYLQAVSPMMYVNWILLKIILFQVLGLLSLNIQTVSVKASKSVLL